MEGCSSQVLDSLWVPNSSPSFHASASMVNFEDLRRDKCTERPLFDSKVENCIDDFDGCFHQPEKKRRLKPDQVSFLEKCFEVENKLEPDRKVQLAKELGLQPRQVAIWFQNRRARYKTKILEKEYDSLKASYDKLKEDYDTLYTEKEKLKNEVHLLMKKLLPRENGKSKPKPEPCDPISPLDFQAKNQLYSSDGVPMVACKQEDAASSGRSDVFDDADSPHNTDGNHSAPLEPADSSHVFNAQDDSLLCFSKFEVECYADLDLQPNSCNLGFPVQDQGTWFWQY